MRYGDFKWLIVNNKTINKVLNTSDDSLYGYFLEVDLEIPKELHDEHNDLPEKIKVIEEMLSPYQFEINKKIKLGVTNKLIPNLYPKNNYVVHYRNLKFYLSQGARLIKVHEILELKQNDWMKPYINFNTEKRKEAANEADKNLFNLFNNSVYGKTMENMNEKNESKSNNY